MSKLSQLKKRVGYQEHVPRCSTCKHHRQKSWMQDSMPIRWFKHCAKHDFTIQSHACCDDWESDAGEVLA